MGLLNSRIPEMCYHKHICGAIFISSPHAIYGPTITVIYQPRHLNKEECLAWSFLFPHPFLVKINDVFPHFIIVSNAVSL